MFNQDLALRDFFVGPGESISIPVFVVNLACAALLGYLLKLTYMHCGRSLSNRAEFGRNFVLVSMATMLVISIVKSSLALSLGLVGALSIVRFRAAIKEPEELCYLFLAVAIGVGFGATQGLITLVAFLVIMVILWARFELWPNHAPTSHLHLIVSSEGNDKIEFAAMRGVIHRHARTVSVHRLDESKDRVEATFQLGFDRDEKLEICRGELMALGPGIKVSFLDQRGLGA